MLSYSLPDVHSSFLEQDNDPMLTVAAQYKSKAAPKEIHARSSR